MLEVPKRTSAAWAHRSSLLKASGHTVNCPVYGEQNFIVRYVVLDLLWSWVGKLVLFEVVVHSTHGGKVLT